MFILFIQLLFIVIFQVSVSERAMEPRRSSRPVIKPVKFWDFEKPDFSKVEQISYSIAELTRTFARPESSAKPKKQAVVSGEDGEKLNAKNPISKKAVQSAKPRKHQRVQSHSVGKDSELFDTQTCSWVCT